jgi:DNA modification methylase
MNYNDFLKSKQFYIKPNGFDVDKNLINKKLTGEFEYQRDVVAFLLKKGSGAAFLDTGLGKTFVQCEWAKQVYIKTKKPVLIVAPLQVAYDQTIEEAKKLDIDIKFNRDGDLERPITITNYENLHNFNPELLGGLALDESSILKNQNGKYRNDLITNYKKVPFKSCYTATPAPNDFMEFGNHVEFLTNMTMTEMLSTFFVHDGGDTSKWRIKGHAKQEFYDFLNSWAIFMKNPKDYGYKYDYVLPNLIENNIFVDAKPTDGCLFAMPAKSFSEKLSSKRETLYDRCEKAAEIANKTDKSIVIWAHLNDESDLLERLIPGSRQLKGSGMTDEQKININKDFQSGRLRVLITKAKISAMGLNWQHSHHHIFVGVDDSYEKYYQAVRRSLRFGQKSPYVQIDRIVSENDLNTLNNLSRKSKESEELFKAIRIVNTEITNFKKEVSIMSDIKKEITNNYTIYNDDCVNAVSQLPSESIDYTIFSPPFSSLYTYSSFLNDMGNCKSDDEFYNHFKFLVKELFRVTKSGHCVSFHCMNLPTSKVRDGYIGIKDFRGDLIRMFEDEGFVYASEVVIWKDPVIAMQRTKALGLLHKQVKKDACMSRQGIPDYVVTMRKNGDNKSPASHDPKDLPVHLWQKYASPIWMDINPSDTLQYRSARDQEDEKHICPLQLEVIRRCIHLWTAKGQTVLSPFMGIGSEGYISRELKRKFIGVELKPSYFDQASKNLSQIDSELEQSTLL